MSDTIKLDCKVDNVFLENRVCKKTCFTFMNPVDGFVDKLKKILNSNTEPDQNKNYLKVSKIHTRLFETVVICTWQFVHVIVEIWEKRSVHV